MKKAAIGVLLFTSAAIAAPAPYVPPAMPAPRRGSLLPWSRIVTYYGNPLSKKMGILGELPPDQMMAGLEREVQEWRKADPNTRVLPGLELVATVAADSPGPSGLYRTRMPDALIDKGVRIVDVFPDDSHPPIVYPIALTPGARSGAQEFIDFLRTPEAQAVFRKYGFTPLPR